MGSEKTTKRCLFFIEMAWAGRSLRWPQATAAPGPLLSVLADGHYLSGRCPRPIPLSIRRAPACATEPPKLSLLGAAPRRRANLSGVVADKQCTCLASKLMRERYPPIPPAFAKASAWRASLNCGENEIQASPISSASVGATPTPATNIYGNAAAGSAIARQCQSSTPVC